MNNLYQNTFGIYFHIPYCIQICNYCDFIKYKRSNFKRNDIIDYNDSMFTELDFYINKYKSLKNLKTIYFGGGTPSLYPKELLKKIIKKLHNSFNINKNIEITIEIDPKTIRKKSLNELYEIGFNRISIGAQSFQNDILKTLGRYHKQKDILECFKDCLDVGFKNISIDLIYGTPLQTYNKWVDDLEILTKLNPEHISLYNLNIAKGTNFHKYKNQYKFLSDSESIKLYNLALKYFKKIQILPYEISNFSKKGFESKHNTDCWNRIPYLGIGVGASSFYDNKRWSNLTNIKNYIKSVKLKNNAITKLKKLSLKDTKIEFVMLKLRMHSGFTKKEYKELFNRDIEKDFPNLFKKEFSNLISMNNKIKLTHKGKLLSNEIFCELI